MKKFAIIIVCIIVAVLAGWAARYFYDSRKGATIEYLTQIDTLTIEKERLVYEPKIVKIRNVDTLYIHDTILIAEQKHYRDSSADIWVSGINVKLDSMLIKTRIERITRTVVKHPKFNLSLSADMEIWHNAIPSVEAIASYSFGKWSLNSGVGVNYIGGLNPYGKIGVTYNLLTK